MSYPYSKYRDEPYVEAYVYAFLQTWEANHVSQRPADAQDEQSKIVELGMTLDRPTARWHAKHLPGIIDKFEALETGFLRLFHR